MPSSSQDNNETDQRDLELIAYHEAGHTVMAKLHGTQVSKVTIIPSTSGAGGVTFTEPSERTLYTKEMMEYQVMQMYGGRVGEYLVSGENWNKTTQGCSSDIEKATEILKDMVDAYGMSDNALVNMSVLGSETSERSTDYIIEMSEQLRDRTVEELKSHWKQLDAIAHALMENETLYENEIDQLMS